LEKVGKSGSKFDPEKAKWFNHQYMINKSDTEVAELFMPVLAEKSIEAGFEEVTQIIGLVKERANFVHDLWDQSYFFFEAPDSYDPKAVKKRWKAASFDQMTELKTVLESMDDFSSENTETVVKQWAEEEEYGLGMIMNAFRLLIVGALKGPHLFDIISIIGKEETLNRINKGLEVIGKKEV
jgi:glutamyl-tRNA synthetase